MDVWSQQRTRRHYNRLLDDSTGNTVNKFERVGGRGVAPVQGGPSWTSLNMFRGPREVPVKGIWGQEKRGGDRTLYKGG